MAENKATFISEVSTKAISMAHWTRHSTF